MNSWRGYKLVDGVPYRAEALFASVFEPGAFWPRADEAPLPDAPSVEVLLASFDGSDALPDGEPLASLEADGFRVAEGGLDEGPWEALITLEAERLAIADGPAAAGSRSTPCGELHTAATSIVEAWPDHPVADYAKLYELEALGRWTCDTYDPGMLADRALDILVTTDDVLVVDAAIAALSSLSTLDLAKMSDPHEALEAFDEAYEASAVAVHRRALALLGLELAMSVEARGEAARWQGRLQEATDVVCGAQQTSWCEAARVEVESAAGFLGADVAPATTWIAALRQAVVACARKEDHLPRTSRGRLAWAEGWRVDGAELPISGCLAHAPMDPSPPPGQRVDLVVLARAP